MIHEKKRIHFIGICGVAMSALALAFHKKGYKVTGSDKGFHPPVSTHLKNAGVEYYPGWHPEKMSKDRDPDLVVVGNVAGSKNPEWLYVQEKKIEYKSYPEVIAEYFVKKNSIVCAGTYGKSTTSALLSWILKENNYGPSYMFGALAWDGFDSAEITDGEYSILEGDEYKTARWDTRPKFKLYSPTHLLLTSVSWDHADIYPTEESYFNEFHDLMKMVPEDGLIAVCSDHEKAIEIAKFSDCKSITYGKNKSAIYQYNNITQTKFGLSFEITHDNKKYKIESQMLGVYMAENITGTFAMASEVGIEPEKIIKSIKNFGGMKRRLEKRFEGDVTVFDDIAHSPEKAKNTLKNLREVYDGKIIAVFEPNTGNRCKESLPKYISAFENADVVLIPRLTKLKQDPNNPNKILDGKQLVDKISQWHDVLLYMEDDEELVDFLVKEKKSGNVIVFLGSHGFRGMIEELIEKLND